MKPFARYVLAAMLAGAVVLHGLPAGAQDSGDDYYRDSAPDPDDYQDALTPYGRWIDHAEYGRVWHPSVAVGWRPYYDGRWVWSPYGWTWVSAEPWGWTFHYGRWSYAPVWGWVWVPGTTWGPAWVDWYWDDGYVGWAPLSPFATHVTVVNQFFFVREHDFCSPHIRRYAVDYRRVPRRVSDRWRDRDFGRGFRAPDRDRIERVSGRPVPRFDDKPPQTVAPRRFRDGDRLARPRKAQDRKLAKEPDLGQARRGGWQRNDRRADDAPDAGEHVARKRDDQNAWPRPRRNPGVARRGPRLSPPDPAPAPAYDAPGRDRPRRGRGDERVMRGGGGSRPPTPGRSYAETRQGGEASAARRRRPCLAATCSRRGMEATRASARARVTGAAPVARWDTAKWAPSEARSVAVAPKVAAARIAAGAAAVAAAVPAAWAAGSSSAGASIGGLLRGGHALRNKPSRDRRPHRGRAAA